MNIADILFSFTINLLSVYLNIKAMKFFITPKKTNDPKNVLLYLIVCIINWMCHYYMQTPWLTTGILFLELIMVSILLFNGTIIKKIISVIMALTLPFISEEIIWQVSSVSMYIPKDEALGNILSCFLTLAVTLFLDHFLHINREHKIPKSYYFQFMLISIGSAVLCDILIAVKTSNPTIITLGLSLICLINICTLFLYDNINSTYQRELEQKAMQQHILMYQNQFELMQQAQDNMRSLRHDWKNHLILLTNYIQQENYDNALSYINELTQHIILTKEYVNTGNNEIDCVLNYLLEQAEQLHCETVVKVEVPSEVFMSNFDLNILLSNLLSNSLEALKDTPEKKLNICIKYDKKVLYISIYNTFTGTLKRKGNYFLTTKEDTENHGYGFSNIHSIVEKYQGESFFRQEENWFKADIILYTSLEV